MSIKSFFKSLLKPADTHLAHFTCPGCNQRISAQFRSDKPYPVYCSDCDTTYMAISEIIEPMPITWEDKLTGECYYGKPMDSL